MWTDSDRETYKADGRRYPSDLTDAEWATIAPLLSVYAPLTVDLRAMVDACLYLDKTGCPWRYLPKDFGAWETVRTWHDRFRADGIWSEIASLLTRAVRRERGRRPEPSTANHKRTYRIYRDEGLSIRSKLPKRKRAWRYRQGRPAIGGPNEVWAMDFMSDRIFDGRPFRILTVVDCKHSVTAALRG